ncbi:hypothetical protein [Entomomonas asaccharolytica]|uniref:Uncharacterized protein n=1 Tax=Entomomonas asaccharolytica TaxID=2785331 RepID=A0A974RVY6_9GAMM|nr:hypothetical protein [Entomomonas asaccharolytica]QQP84532.1 hypothetical protein JHT90_08905 [Entomomonas asaccharolytica]
MKKSSIKNSANILLICLVCFCGVFSIPFLSNYVATLIIESVGCSGTGGIPAPTGNCHISFFNRFYQFTGIGTFVSPIVLVVCFWDILLIWIASILILNYIDKKMK